MENGMTIRKTIWKDGPNGEEREVPVAFIPSSDFTGPGSFRVFEVLNPRGRAYAFRNDLRFRNKKSKVQY